MSSMYETIMGLPLFKGIGEEQLSLLLEKTSVEFVNCEDGEILYQPGDNVRYLNFILNGKVRKTYKLRNFEIEISEVMGEGSVIGALHLYGLDTSYPCRVEAVGNVSIMKIAKLQYMNILHSDNIYMMNFVNYLSAASQRRACYMLNAGSQSINRSIGLLVNSIISSGAETVRVEGEASEIARFCSVSTEEFERWKHEEFPKSTDLQRIEITSIKK